MHKRTNTFSHYTTLSIELQFKIQEQEKDIQKLNSHIIEQNKHIHFLDSAFQKQERRCKESHIPREKLHLLLTSHDHDKAQSQSIDQTATPIYAHANNEDSQIPLTGTRSINNNLLPSGVKDSVMNSDYCSNTRTLSGVNVLDQGRVENITSSLSKINLSTMSGSNSSSTDGGGHPKVNEINQNKKVLTSGLNRASSSLVQSAAPTSLGTTNSFPNLDRNCIIPSLLSNKTLQNDR